MTVGSVEGPRLRLPSGPMEVADDCGREGLLPLPLSEEGTELSNVDIAYVTRVENTNSSLFSRSFAPPFQSVTATEVMKGRERIL